MYEHTSASLEWYQVRAKQHASHGAASVENDSRKQRFIQNQLA